MDHLQLTLRTENGRVTFNGKSYFELNASEQVLFSEAIKQVKIESEVESLGNMNIDHNPHIEPRFLSGLVG